MVFFLKLLVNLVKSLLCRCWLWVVRKLRILWWLWSYYLCEDGLRMKLVVLMRLRVGV